MIYIYIYTIYVRVLRYKKRFYFCHDAGGCKEFRSSAANEDGYDFVWCWRGTPSQRTWTVEEALSSGC